MNEKEKEKRAKNTPTGAFIAERLIEQMKKIK